MTSIGTGFAARAVKPVRRRERLTNASTVASLTNVVIATQLRSASTTNDAVFVSRVGVVLYANTVAEWIKIVTSAPLMNESVTQMPTRKKISTTEFASPGQRGNVLRVTRISWRLVAFIKCCLSIARTFPTMSTHPRQRPKRARRFQNKVELRRLQQAPKGPNLTDAEVTDLLAEFGF